MGDGGHIPLALRSRGLAVIACFALSACWDFVEPDLPARAGAAVLSVNALTDPAGVTIVDGLLAPGFDADGFTRDVLRDTLGVSGLRIAPLRRRSNGSLVYGFTDTIHVAGGPFTVDPPVLRDVRDRPIVRWPGIRRLGGDTLHVLRGSDVVFRIVVDDSADPKPPTQQWLLDLIGKETRFQVGGSGTPPLEIIVPARFIPAPDTAVAAILSFIQSGQPLTQSYRGIYNHTAQLAWIVIVQ